MQNPLPSSTSTKNPLVKLAVTLLALAAPLAFAASCTSGGDDPAPESLESVESVEQGISCNCINALGVQTSIECPADNSCGEWYCTGLKGCSVACGFKKELGEGDKCKTVSGNTGACMQNDAGNGLMCCGCYDKEEKRCYDGGGPQHCGVQGDSCQTCKADACNAATCQEGKCGVEPTNEGGDCNDNNVCTLGDKCNKGVCKGPGTLNCSDGNPCTTDACDPEKGCTTHEPVPNNPPQACNDGNFCTGPDQCVNGQCSGAAVTCDDGKPCTDNSCNPATGCVFPAKALNASCDDGSSCTTGETCQDDDDDPGTPLNCVSDDGVACNNGNPCIDPDCVGAVCPAEPVFLDGNACSTSLCMVNETCSSGNCQGGQAKNCDDGNPCTIDTCNEATGCLNVPIPSGTTVLCDDANPCTTRDECDGDTCKGTEIECTPLDSCHKAGSCNEEDGTCSDPRQPDGTTCDTTGECDEGVCIGGTVVTPGEGGANGEGGAPEPGAGGAPSGATGGETASGGTAGEGSGATSSGGTETDPNKQGGIYARDPGGCSCSVPGAPSERRAQGTLALLLVAGAAFLRRKRAA